MSFKYYDAFIASKNKQIPCCNKILCNLCFGKQEVQVQQDDINLIDRLIQDKLQSRFQEIQQNLKIKTLDQFLDYHQRKYSYQTTFSYEFEKKGKPGEVKSFCFKFKNNGKIDWSDDPYFKCLKPKEFLDMKSHVKSLQSGAEENTQITFKIPQIKGGLYITKWRLCCKRQDEEVQFGPTIEIELEIDQQIEKQSFEESNKLLFKQLESQSSSIKQLLDFSKAPKILEDYKYIELNLDQLFNYLLKKDK